MRKQPAGAVDTMSLTPDAGAALNRLVFSRRDLLKRAGWVLPLSSVGGRRLTGVRGGV